ncbi:hypothetical protein [Aquimarina pacifica]|uniref:hypothetical protein n=1 Tax=Aquimarina pacifica TaxID=1296415 RepID=UPI0004BC3259|nr:hypothetical protein [Aquimarina pacifica]
MISTLNTAYNDIITLVSGLFLICGVIVSIFGLIFSFKEFKSNKIIKGLFSLLLNITIPLFVFILLIMNGIDIYRALFE